MLKVLNKCCLFVFIVFGLLLLCCAVNIKAQNNKNNNIVTHGLKTTKLETEKQNYKEVVQAAKRAAEEVMSYYGDFKKNITVFSNLINYVLTETIKRLNDNKRTNFIIEKAADDDNAKLKKGDMLDSLSGVKENINIAKKKVEELNKLKVSTLKEKIKHNKKTINKIENDMNNSKTETTLQKNNANIGDDSNNGKKADELSTLARDAKITWNDIIKELNGVIEITEKVKEVITEANKQCKTKENKKCKIKIEKLYNLTKTQSDKLFKIIDNNIKIAIIKLQESATDIHTECKHLQSKAIEAVSIYNTLYNKILIQKQEKEEIDHIFGLADKADKHEGGGAIGIGGISRVVAFRFAVFFVFLFVVHQ